MKNIFSRFLKFTEPQKGKRGLLVWLFFHLSIPALLLFSFFVVGPIRINTSLFDMLPKPAQSKEVILADAVLSEKNSRELIILSSAPDFQTAKNGAVVLSHNAEYFSEIQSISLFFDDGQIEDFYRYLYDYRFAIAGKETISLLESGRADEIAYDALSSAYSAINLTPLDNIENDPFFLAQRRMNDFLSSSMPAAGNMAVKDDVLAAEIDGCWYVLLRLTLAPDAFSIQPKKNIVKRLYAASNEIKQLTPELDFYFSGVPFHSYESSSGAQNEISLIGTVTIILILILFIYIFRSPLPVIASIAAVSVSLGLGTAATLLVFKEMHIITFVFGTTLIGTCVDYSVHFFTNWKGNPALESGLEIRKHISKSIIMSFISTEICFFVLFFAPFAILKQFALFSMTGLLSSFLTCFCIYPRLKLPSVEKRNFKVFDGKIFSCLKNLSIPRTARTVVFICLAVTAALVIIINISFVKIENKLSSLYTMSPFLLESEKKTAQVLDHGSVGWYFIVSGDSAEETLQHEEELALHLEEEIQKGNLSSFLAASQFSPSIKRQKNTYKAMKTLLPIAERQFDALGFSQEYVREYEKQFADAESQYCLPQDAPSFTGISSLWIGEQKGRYYSCVMPLKPKDEAIFRKIAEDNDNVYFINKQKDIGTDLDTLTKTIFLFFIGACFIVSIIIRFVYSLRDSLKIYAVPVFLVFAALAVLSANKIHLGFFSAAALILVFGLGLDYIFYMTAGKKENNSLALLGVTLSFLTTLLSFGALALSSFIPVHIFGLTVSAGLGAAFICAVFFQIKER